MKKENVKEHLKKLKKDFQKCENDVEIFEAEIIDLTKRRNVLYKEVQDFTVSHNKTVANISEMKKISEQINSNEQKSLEEKEKKNC